MDTHGHHECADQAGLPLITAALVRARKPGWRTGAFYLGNWITDVQQAVDPQPYTNVANGVREGVDGAVKAIMSLEILNSPGWIRNNLTVPLTKFLGEIKAAASALDGGQDSQVAGMMRKAFFVMGYDKFVHPEHRHGPARMDYKAYKHVFDSSYTQYYPHEHLDRYPQFAVTAQEQATRSADKHGTGSRPLSPHLYDYLIEDIQIAAGLLAKIDRDWAQRTFSPKGQAWPDADANLEWNMGLARLGHAVHALEDFFAHSNFVEHAMHARARTLKDEHSKKIFENRLAKLNPDESIGSPFSETNVVTGYFDSWDTLHSLAHVAQELGLRVEAHLDRAPEPPGVHGHGTKLGRLMVELVRKIKNGPKTRATVEAALSSIVSGGDPSVDAAVRDAARFVMHEIPPEAKEVKDAFFDTVLALAADVPGSSLTVADALILLAEMHERLMYPWEFFKWMVSELPLGAAKWIVENIGDAIEDRIREPFDRAVRRIIEEHLGRFRVGSHSLLAKDYEWPHEEEINTLHTHAINLAKSVHWYVIKAMTRHTDPPRVAVTRAAYEDRDLASKNLNVLGFYTWIDWLELCETFLRHPAGDRKKSHDTPLPSPSTIPDIQKRWWNIVMEGRSFRRFPGYTGTAKGWDARLPHSLIFISPAELDDQITAAESLRKNAENAYNGVEPTPPPPPPAPTGKIVDLQKILGVATTNVWDDATEQAARRNMVAHGSRGAIVEWVQTQLNAQGMDSGKADGICGVLTTGAIRRWQSKTPGLSVDGIAGPRTMQTLAEA
ncbi:MAG: peptidoglycan-binding protein [Phycisphaeraceae bacterium]|nr:peptidoglycan-binding protein [Phycisphaeraceae bacterium]MCW5763321.1 peptidoglycan-binding protein [Phycisphaeraceae bacterium]